MTLNELALKARKDRDGPAASSKICHKQISEQKQCNRHAGGPQLGDTRNKESQISTSSDTFKNSFFPCTIPWWNSLPAAVAEAPDLASFKQELSIFSF